jgi:hypothetical protein
MSIIDLINESGVENVKVQFLSECMVGSVSTDTKGITKITFKTNAISCTEIACNIGMIGVVVWMPRPDIDSKFPPKDK